MNVVSHYFSLIFPYLLLYMGFRNSNTLLVNEKMGQLIYSDSLTHCYDLLNFKSIKVTHFRVGFDLCVAVKAQSS
jgi:hypothetical protein